MGIFVQDAAPRLNQERQSSLELLRIVSMLLIILHHLALYARPHLSNTEVSFNRFFLQVLLQVGALGDNLFVLISGYFLVNSTFKVRRLLRVWGEVFFYSMACALIVSICNLPGSQALTPRDWLRVCTPITSGLYWFASTYMLLSLFSPFLNKLIHSLERRDLVKLNWLLFIIVSVLQTFAQDFAQLSKLSTFILLYCLAAYVRLYPDQIRYLTNRRRSFAFGLGVLALMLLFVLGCMLLSPRYERFRYYISFFSEIYATPQVLAALGLFMGFKGISMRPSRLINTVASAAFGVYLIHENRFLRGWIWSTLMRTVDYLHSPWLVVRGICFCVGIFIACALIDLARQKTAERLFLGAVDRLPYIRRENARARR